MPLWKNVKNTKISQMVNNHLHNSQKRRDGSSFVVETGFPTSLIDLFIKNRDKLQKPPSKKKRSIVVPPKSVYNQVIEGSPTPYPSPVSSPSRVPVDEIVVVKDCDFVDEKRNRGVDANGVLKMFLVVILALGIKRLTLGFTFSAFLLFFLGSVGKRFSESLKLCLGARGVLMLCSILRLKLDRTNNRNDSCISVRRSESRVPIQEIQTVESKDLENQVEDDLCFDCEEKELKEFMCDGMEQLKRRKRRDRIKLKMTKFVAKKLQNSREEEHHLDRLEIDNIALSEGLKVNQRKDESESVSDSSSKLSNATEESVWRYLLLVLIILIGLVGGRAFAFLLTLSWCLLLKFVEITLQRYIKRSL